MAVSADILDARAESGAQSGPTSLRRRRTDKAWPYIRGAVLSVACVWAFVATYLAFTPRSYVSRWTLNLPGAGSNVTVSLETIGQSTTTPNSPFGSASLSPKVVYREIAEGEKVRAAAAHTLGMTLIQFGKPRVKLIDETALILFEMGGTSPDDAKRRGDALLGAFNAELDTLRDDELEKRAAAVKSNLQNYQSQVRLAREATVRAQFETGLVSTNQFGEMVTSLTGLRRRSTELAGELDRMVDEHKRLSERLGISAAEAGRALTLASDTTLTKAMGEYSDATLQHAADNERFGLNHPQLKASSNRLEAARSQIAALIERIVPQTGTSVDIGSLATLASSSGRADLYQTLVRNEALIEGRRRELSSMIADKARLDAEVTRLSAAASRLEDLKKDQIVADAVLSSALARLDSSKSDIFGSYPIAQTVAVPDLPEFPVQPRLLYAALGGFSGTLFACLSWMLAWLQFVHRSTRRKSA